MEKNYFIIFVVFSTIFILSMVISYVYSIVVENNDYLRKKIVKLWIYLTILSIIYPLIYPLFFDGYKSVSLLSIFVFFMLILNDQKIRNMIF